MTITDVFIALVLFGCVFCLGIMLGLWMSVDDWRAGWRARGYYENEKRRKEPHG